VTGTEIRRAIVILKNARDENVVGEPLFTRLKDFVPYASNMLRNTWIAAACIIDQYGDNAIDVVQQRLNALEDERAHGGSGLELQYWCAIGRAMLEILRATREGGELAH